MSDKLKKFVTEHKEEFDSNEPDKDLWSKIDAKMEAKDPSRISSNWLLKFKYIWFSASILVIAIFVIASNSTSNASDEEVQKDLVVRSAMEEQGVAKNASAIKLKANSSLKTEIDKEKKNAKERSKETRIYISNDPNHDTLKIRKEITQTVANVSQEEITESDSDSISETERKTVPVSSIKKTKFSVPAKPGKIDTYTGTLYTGADFCAMLRAYKFPGKVGLDMGKMATISCSRLARRPNMKAVWLKGVTSKKVMFSLMDKFKSISLVKSDGRKINPEAVSHYYPGLMVISAYNGKFFNVAFEDNVDMILFFKDAEEGDKIVIDGSIEAYVKAQE